MTMLIRRAFVNRFTPFLSLEADVLQSFGGLAVQQRGLTVVSTARGEIALRHPDARTSTDGLELLEAAVGLDEVLLGLVEPPLLDQRAAQDQLRATDRLEEVHAAVEQP